MEENTYPLFLKSDPYLEYTQTGEESPKPPSDHSSSSGTGPGPLGPGYLPTLTEDVEWRCVCLSVYPDPAYILVYIVFLLSAPCHQVKLLVHVNVLGDLRWL